MTSTPNSPAQKLGEYLRLQREKRGFSIEQVASATKINLKQIQLLENDQFKDLPAKPFVRGFVQSYCAFLNLDAREILLEYNLYLDDRCKERPNREAGHSGYAFEKKEGDQDRTLLWITLGGFGVIGGILLILFKPALKHKHSKHLDQLKASPSVSASVEPESNEAAPVLVGPSASPLPTVQPSAVKPTPIPTPTVTPTVAAATPSPSPSPSPTVAPVSNGKPDPLKSGADLSMADIKQKIIITALADTWVRYKVDEKESNRIILRQGKKLVLKSTQAIRFQVASYASISMNLNGRKIEAPKTQTFGSGNTVVVGNPSTEDPFPTQKPLPADVPASPNAAPPKPATTEGSSGTG